MGKPTVNMTEDELETLLAKALSRLSSKERKRVESAVNKENRKVPVEKQKVEVKYLNTCSLCGRNWTSWELADANRPLKNSTVHRKFNSCEECHSRLNNLTKDQVIEIAIAHANSRKVIHPEDLTPKKRWYGSTPKKCDICSAPIESYFVDGLTFTGQWGIMCKHCFPLYGSGLGPGKGQAYSKVHETYTDDEEKKQDVFVKVGG